MDEAKRQKILLGMLEAVGADGYRRASVSAAVERAGVHRQSFYDLFADKEDCYLAALDEETARIGAELAAAVARGETWRERMRAALAALLGRVEAGPDVARALLVEVHAAGRGAVARHRAAVEAAARAVDLARVEATEEAPEIAAEAVVSGVLTVLQSRLAAGRRGGYAELLPELTYFAALPYFGAEGAAAEMRLAESP